MTGKTPVLGQLWFLMKVRNVYICNLKALLIFFVVFSHFIERDIGTNSAAQAIYRSIYLFHIPLFVFTSGLGIKTSRAAFMQAANAAKMYLLAQAIVILIYIIQKRPVSRLLLQPYWHLWYLLSLCFWCAAVGLILCREERQEKKGSLRRPHTSVRLLIFSLSLVLGLAVGLIPEINRTLSLSRTVVFFPYFIAAAFWGKEILERLSNRKILLVLLPTSALFLLVAKKIPLFFLYQARGYSSFSLETLGGGVAVRWVSYLAAMALGSTFMALCSRQRTFFTKVGLNTLWIYLLHPIMTFVQPLLSYTSAGVLPLGLLATCLTIVVTYFSFRRVGSGTRYVLTYEIIL